MAVKLTLVEVTETGPVFEAFDLATEQPVVAKNWFEKSKDKWHVVLGPNSANRKYIAHNEVKANLVDGVYVVEDKTTGPRVLGTSQPDRKLVPYMSAEDKDLYDAIMARALENKNSQRKVALTDEEKLIAKIEKLKAQLANYTQE